MNVTDIRKKLELGAVPRSGKDPGTQPASGEFPLLETRGSIAPKHVVPMPESWPERDTWPMPPVPSPVQATNGDPTVAMIDIARRIVSATLEEHEAFATEDKAFWLYADGYHHKLASCWLDEAIIQYDGQRPRNPDEPAFRADPRTMVGVTNMVERLLRISQKETPGRYFDSPDAVVFANGSIPTDTFAWTEHSPQHRASFGYDDVEYSPGQKPMHLPLVMRDWFAGETDEEIDKRILAIRQYAGHAILGTLSHMKLSLGLMLVGKGHDGKSALLDIIKACLPPGSCSSVDPAELCSKSLAVDITRASLIGKRANICGDCTAQTWHDTGFLKRMHDHDEVSVRRQGKDAQTFRCDLAALYACNELPRVLDTSHGFFRRWRLIHFPNRVPDDCRDPLLVRKLIALEKQAIVCWFVDAALDMLRGKQNAVLAEPECHHTLLRLWQAGDDSVARFIFDECSAPGDDIEQWETGAALYERYLSYQAFTFGPEQKPSNRNNFSKRLLALGIQTGRRGKNRDRVVALKRKETP